MSVTVRVWDLPTWIFHGSLVVGIIGLVTTAQIGDSAMGWHFRFGYAELALLLFGVVWGEVVSAATAYHTEIGKFVLIGLVVLHICAIIFHRFNKHESLVRPMIRGDKIMQLAADGSRDDAGSRTLAAIVFLACAAMVAGVLKIAR